SVSGDSDDMLLRRGRDQRLEPRWRGRAIALARGVGAARDRHRGDRNPGRLAPRYPDGPKKPHVPPQGRQHLLRRHVRWNDLQGFADEKLREPGRGFDLDARRGAGLENRDSAGEQRGSKLDRQNNDEQLTSYRVTMPK